MGHYNDRDVAPAWNDFPESERWSKPTYGTDYPVYRHEPETTRTVTDSDSKTVMLQAGRRDKISIKDVVERFVGDVQIPDMVSVIKRSAVYFGPELHVHAEHDGEDYNYLLTAPGPDAHLVLWAATTRKNDGGRKVRRGWFPAAEVTAYLHEPDHPHRWCQVCGQPMETIQHERESLFGICTRGRDA